MSDVCDRGHFAIFQSKEAEIAFCRLEDDYYCALFVVHVEIVFVRMFH